MKKLIRISASDYTPHLIKVSPADKKYILDKLNKSHKTLGDLGSVGDPRYYVSEFEDAAYGLWSSDTGLRILDDNGIEYELVKKSVESSTVKASSGQSFEYQLLGRLKSDCEYLLAEYRRYETQGDSSREGRKLAQKFLWANNAKDQIAKMRELYRKLKVKPEWITLEDIAEYERQFKEILGKDYRGDHEYVGASNNPFYDKLSDKDKGVADSQLRSKYPYQIVSMAAILRDHIDLVDKAYKDATHKKLTDIADSLYNVGLDPAEMYPEYSQLYDRMGKAYFDKVLDDMYAIDGQLTSDAKVQELIEDYEDRLGVVTASTITCSSDVEIEDMWCDLSDVPFDELPDGRLVLAEDWEQFPAGTDREDIWQFFDKNYSKGVAYLLYDFDRTGRCRTNASTKVTASSDYDTKIISKYLKTLFDDEAFGTSKSSSLSSFYGNNPNDPDIYMNRNGLRYNRRNNTIDLIGNTREEDTPIYKVIPQYSSTKRQGTYAPKMPKLVPIDEWNATHGVTASTRVMASRWYYYEPMSEQELADLEADILALPGCDKLDMDTNSMEEMGHICILPGYNDISLSDPQYYEKRKQLLKDILRVAKEHGLSRTEDTIEDYGSCWYIVLRTNKPKTDEYEEYDY